VDYFDETMERLRSRFLNVPLTAVLHPMSLAVQQVAAEQKAAARAAPAVQQKELTAEQWFERGFAATDASEKMRSYSEAIRLKPDFADAFYNRGNARYAKGDDEGAIHDYSEAVSSAPAATAQPRRLGRSVWAIFAGFLFVSGLWEVLDGLILCE
jgi:tetratricopeptide (TPR) repeat protein